MTRGCIGSNVSSIVNRALLLYVTTTLLAGVAECLTLSLILLFLLCRYNNNNNMVILIVRYFAPILNIYPNDVDCLAAMPIDLIWLG
jgi:hypothetical protein